MKKLSLVCCTIALSLITAPVLCKKRSNNTKPKIQTPHSKPHGKTAADKEKAIILGHFAGIVSSFLTLVQDPHNTTHVGHHLGDMVHGVANIISTAIRKGKKIEEYVQSQEFKKEIAQLVVKRMPLIEATDHVA